MSKPVANVYIDGFNLYYGCVKGTPYRWLDLLKLAGFMLPEYEIGRLRYFTARVRPRPDDPDKHLRQQMYLRALSTLPRFTLHEGYFLESQVSARLVTPIPCHVVPACVGNVRSQRVYKTEEKGSDVNLATTLLLDAFDGDGDASWVVSNDSDLVFPLRMAAERFGRTVGILNPHRHASRELGRVVPARDHRTIKPATLRVCQFPPVLSDAEGSFHKPPAW